MLKRFGSSSGNEVNNYFEISPGQKETPVEKKIILILKPFAAKPHISFENVLVGSEQYKTLHIYNPHSIKITVELISRPPADRQLEVSATCFEVPATCEVEILLTWKPNEAGTWYDTLSFKDDKGRRGTVSVTFESIAPKKVKDVGRNRGGPTRKSTAVAQVKRVGKLAAKPYWRVPLQPQKPPIASMQQSETWVDPSVNLTLPAFEASEAACRRETYIVAENTFQTSMYNNKENVSAAPVSNFAAAMNEITSVNPTPYFSRCNEKREPFSVVKDENNTTDVCDANLSLDSIKMTPLKILKPKFKFLEQLNTEIQVSPLVILNKPVAESINNVIDDSFIIERGPPQSMSTLLGDTHIIDLSFAEGRCSTTSKDSGSRRDRVNDLTPSRLFSPTTERRLSSGTYVISSHNSLETGASGDSSRLHQTSPVHQAQRLVNIDEEWSTVIKDRNTNSKLKVTVLPDEDFEDSLEVVSLNEKSKFDFDSSLLPHAVKSEKQFTSTYTFEITQPSNDLQQAASISMVGTSFHGDGILGPVTFQISPPKCKVDNREVSVKSVVPVKSEVPNSFQIPAPSFETKEVSMDANVTDNTGFMHISPPKPFSLPNFSGQDNNVDSSCSIYDLTLATSFQNKTHYIPQKQNAGVYVKVGLPQKLKLQHTETFTNSEAERECEEEILHDPDLILYNFALNDFNFSGALKDPFHLNPLLCEAILLKYEVDFTKWLNSILTPEEFGTDEEIKVNAADLWVKSTKEGVAGTLAPSRELVTIRYLSVKSRLDQLRRAACNLFQEHKIVTVVCCVIANVDSGKLKIRPDKNLHLNQGLKKQLLALFFNYNPLWLRIGLEVVLGRTIPLKSNSDIAGLGNFICNRILSAEAVVGKSHLLLNERLRDVFHRFVLKKFLLLVYFLDQAKARKLIRHDPCLFRTNSDINASKDMLLTFSRLLLAGEGDVTKHLGYMGYKVSHKQGYLDTYRYSVKHLGVDLRDGVRLTRVVELVTGNNTLSSKLRVNASVISRLQKIYNVDVALKGLKAEGYEVQNLQAADIVAGHREKTLSLLWQILHKFQYPRFEKSAKTIQKWWLYPTLKTVIGRRILTKTRNKAATTIQKYVRGFLCRRKWESLVKEAQMMKHHHTKAIVIQRNIRAFLRKRNAARQAHLQKQHDAARVIQRNVKCFVLKQRVKDLSHQAKLKRAAQREASALKIQCLWRSFIVRRHLKQLKVEHSSAIKIQCFLKCVIAKKIYKALKVEFQKKNAAAVSIQSAWRMYKSRQIVAVLKQQHFEKRQNAAIVIQCLFRCYKAKCLLNLLKVEDFERKEKNATKIQNCWRCYTAKKTLNLLKQEKKLEQNSALLIQCSWRSFVARKLFMQLKNEHFEKKTKAATSIQCWWRCYIAHKVLRQLQLEHLMKQHKSAIIIQCAYRNYSAKKTLQALKNNFIISNSAALVIQQAWRCYKAREILSAFKQAIEAKRNIAALTLQCAWRCYASKLILKQLQHEDFDKKTNACVTIQSAWKCHKARRILAILRAENFEKKTKAAVIIQCCWKSHVAKRTLHTLRRNKSAVQIQCAWKCYKAKSTLQKLREERLVTLNSAALIVQSAWRCYAAKKIVSKLKQDDFMRKSRAALNIQCTWKCFLARRILQNLKEEDLRKRNFAAIKIQCLWRCRKAVRILDVLKQQDFKRKTDAATIIQCAWKCFLARWILKNLKEEDLRKRNSAAIKIQCLWRCRKAVRILDVLKQQDFKRKTDAATIIQCTWKCFISRKILKNLQEEDLRKRNSAAIKIQCLWRCRKAVRILDVLKQQDFKRKTDAATIIQCTWKCFISRKILKNLQEEDLRKRNSAAIKIQCLWRCRKAVRILDVLKQQDYKRKIDAATIIQCGWKCFLARRILQNLREEDLRKRNSAAIKIQCLWRRCTSVRILDALKYQDFKRKTDAATIIQCAWRCFVARRTLKNLQEFDFKKKSTAALKIQCKWRRYKAVAILNTLKQQDFEKKTASTVRIQCAWRCFVSRKILEKLKEENLKKKQNAALVIQCAWRRHKASEILDMLKEQYCKKKTFSTITIQCAWRCYLARKQLASLKQANKEIKHAAAIKIQCAFRCYLAKQYLDLLKQLEFTRCNDAALKIQNWWRVAAAKMLLNKLKAERENKYQQAALKIQCLWRVHLAHKALNRLKELEKVRQENAVTVIQSYWRRYRACVIHQQQKMTLSAVTIQCAWRCYKSRGLLRSLQVAKHEKAKNREKMIRIEAAVKIQALWRGYACRRNNLNAAKARQAIVINLGTGEDKIHITADKLVQVVQKHEKIQEVTRNAKLEDSIAIKLQVARNCLGKSMAHDMYAMNIFDNYLTISENCVPVVLDSLEYILNMLESNNRSIPFIEICLPATGALLSLSKHPLSQPVVWMNKRFIPSLLITIAASKDSPQNEVTFNNVCTMLWMLAQDPVQSNELKNYPGLQFQLKSASKFIQSRLKSQKQLKKKQPLKLPTLRFNKEPRRFSTRLHGLYSVMKCLGFPIPN